ncbi:MAG: hypothetical protein BMS9Abin05_2499 [Rhodothermia bacterium]|nr:MAG: hypothetical protein BMS9Abin05_2499 [Rhodothermia bacterium]
MMTRVPTILLSAFTLVFFAGCEPWGEEKQFLFQDPWELVDAPAVGENIRILLYHDMEGLAGQDDPRTFSFSKPQYPQGQEMLAADINAVVDGLFAGGATQVHIVDGHGSGNPEPDLRTDLLDPRAQQVFRDEYFDAYFDLTEDDLYDAVGVVGMHAKTGSGGFASHTFTLGIDLLLNGQSITETELLALSWGRADVPLIFASGDDRLENDLQTMPWIEFAQVKTATSASSADLRPVDEAHADMREAAKRAVENLGNAKVMKVITPVRATVRAVPPASLELLENVPGIDYGENSATFVAESMQQAYDGLVALVGVATRNYASILFENLRARPGGPEIMNAYRDSLVGRWFDVESNRWQPDSDPSLPTQQRGHGYR